MLTRLLSILREGGTRRLADLAEELGTTPQLVQAMLEDLTQMGYVKPVSSACSSKCEGCPMAGTCAAGGPAGGGGQVWVLAK